MPPQLGMRDSCLVMAARGCMSDLKTCALLPSMTCSAVSCPAVNIW